MSAEVHAWAADLGLLRAHVWDRLVRGVHDRRAAARHPTLATVAPDGLPEARTVVSRQSYGTLPAPGHAISDAFAFVKQADPEAFAVLRLSVQAIDALHLGRHHRRARFERTLGWAGQWLVP
jgi:pyridoxamine 5'-phosphate oxidase